MPADSCHFPCTSDTLVRPQYSLTRKALSATRGLAREGLCTRQPTFEKVEKQAVKWISVCDLLEHPRGNETIYLHRSGPPLLENGLDRPENRYARYGFASFPAFPYLYRRGGWSQSFPVKSLFSCSLGGGRYFSVPCISALDVKMLLRSGVFLRGAAAIQELQDHPHPQ